MTINVKHILIGLGLAISMTLGMLTPQLSHAQTPKDPSLNEIYQAAHTGKVADAETMINQVLINHPDSARAHYVAAEVYAKAGKLSDARLQLEAAEKINPTLSFIKPDSVDRLKSQLGLEKSAGSSARAPSWVGWIVGFALIFLVIAVVRRLFAPKPQLIYNQGYQTAGANNGAFNPTPYGAGYPPPSNGMGSTIMGGLATGAAVGAGIVAGEALMHKILDDEQPHSSNNNYTPSHYDNPNSDMGGDNFGMDNSGSWDDGGSPFTDSGSDSSSDWT